VHGVATPASAEGFRVISGLFFRAILADRLHQVLAPPAPGSAGRYHRLGQPALYTSPSAEWATIAVSGYMREDGLRRVVVPILIGEAQVVDQRDDDACAFLGINPKRANEPWRAALAKGEEPPSWLNADAARAAGADGIIDVSRMIPGGWHLNLFRWNELGGPSVEVIGEPTEIELSAGGPKWGL
jgi:RES domain-containing protein